MVCRMCFDCVYFGYCQQGAHFCDVSDSECQQGAHFCYVSDSECQQQICSFECAQFQDMSVLPDLDS